MTQSHYDATKSDIKSTRNTTRRQHTGRQLKDSLKVDDKRGMRSFLKALGLMSCIVISSGCMALEEIDKASAMLEGSTPTETETAASSATAAATENPLLKQSKKWWKKATSLSPSGIDTGIVNCRIGNHSKFMSKDDCLIRGGVVKAAS